MFVYALATIPLMEAVGHPTDGVDVWYADDALVCASLSDLQNWFDSLLHIGPDYGYHPEPTKCVVVVNDSYLPLARDNFDRYGVCVSTSHRLLGGFIGDTDGVASLLTQCVVDWSAIVWP